MLIIELIRKGDAADCDSWLAIRMGIFETVANDILEQLSHLERISFYGRQVGIHCDACLIFFNPDGQIFKYRVDDLFEFYLFKWNRLAADPGIEKQTIDQVLHAIG